MVKLKTLFILLIITSLVSCTSLQDRIKNGNIVGTGWWNPNLHTVFYFKENTVVLSLFNGSPFSKYSIRTARLEKSYTYNKSNNTGEIEGSTFIVKPSLTGDNGYYITFQGNMYILDEQLSTPPDDQLAYPQKQQGENNINSGNDIAQSRENNQPISFEKYAGDYSGDSKLGYSVGLALITLDKSGRIAIRYDHPEGSETECGQLIGTGETDANNISKFEFKRDIGGANYKVQIKQEEERTILWLFGYDWTVTVIKSNKVNKFRNDTANVNWDSIAFREPQMIYVQGGIFMMGSDDKEEREKPIHAVKVNSFYVSKYEITQAQWFAIMHNNPSQTSKCPDCPVESVSWNQAQEFTKKINQLTGKHYRLPTEAEWEYAAKGGNKTKHYIYSGSNDVDVVAINGGNGIAGESDIKPQKVGQKKPNELGVYDMSGNVSEWCNDWLDMEYYTQKISDNPQGPSTGEYKIYRGGSWYYATDRCRCSYRDADLPTYKGSDCGFRLVRNP